MRVLENIGVTDQNIATHGYKTICVSNTRSFKLILNREREMKEQPLQSYLVLLSAT